MPQFKARLAVARTGNHRVLFSFGKILAFIVEPLNLVILIQVLATLLILVGRRWAGASLSLIVAAVMVVAWLTPLPARVAHSLEVCNPPMRTLPERVDGIILIGSAELPEMTRTWGIPSVNGFAETIVSFVSLAKHFPNAKLVASGGSGDFRYPDLNEGDTVSMMVRSLGLDPARILFENKSRTTYENAMFSKDIAEPHKDETWLLITQAMHMPRSVAVFRQVGWPVVPFPVAFKSDPDPPFPPYLSASNGFSMLENAMHEWIGLFIYYVTDRTDRFRPC